MIETLQTNSEFEQEPHREIEQKFIPLFPDTLQEFRETATPIEQVYLSHPDEAFSLRLREHIVEGKLEYTATLKDKGMLTEHGLDRLEVETPISFETYQQYKDAAPLLRKLRAEPIKNIAIDFFEDGHIQIESENPISLSSFKERFGQAGLLADATGDKQCDNEWRAHLEYRRQNYGKSALELAPELDPAAITHDIWRAATKQSMTVVAVGGRSGSGKSTLVRELQGELTTYDLASTVLSTDDYHRGKTWLENYKGDTWTEWDAPIVYDTAALAEDLAQLSSGVAIAKRRFNFSTEEPEQAGIVSPTSVVFIEGIYAGSSDLSPHLYYEVPTPLATCIGRRLLRDLRERPQFADPERSLRYALEQAEPAYRVQKSKGDELL